MTDRRVGRRARCRRGSVLPDRRRRLARRLRPVRPRARRPVPLLHAVDRHGQPCSARRRGLAPDYGWMRERAAPARAGLPRGGRRVGMAATAADPRASGSDSRSPSRVQGSCSSSRCGSSSARGTFLQLCVLLRPALPALLRHARGGGVRAARVGVAVKSWRHSRRSPRSASSSVRCRSRSFSASSERRARNAVWGTGGTMITVALMAATLLLALVLRLGLARGRTPAVALVAGALAIGSVGYASAANVTTLR